MRTVEGVRARARIVFGATAASRATTWRRAQLLALVDLHERQRRFERATVAPAVRPGPAHLVEVLTKRCSGLTGAENVLVHGTDIPRGAVGGKAPLPFVERAEQAHGPLELEALQQHRLLMRQGHDRRDLGRRLCHLGPPLMRGRRRCSSGLAAVRQEHRDGLVYKARPSLSARVVRDLLAHEAGHKRREQVDMTRLADSVEPEPLPGLVQGAHRRRVGLRCRLETGQGALEEELVAHRIARAELAKASHTRHEQRAGSSVRNGEAISSQKAVAAWANMAS